MILKQAAMASTPRLLLAGAIAAVLTGCGGGSGDDDGFADENLDGIGDVTLTTDQDSDGLDDVDVDGDGVADFDINGDGIRDTDVNGDGSVDSTVLDEFGLLVGFDTDADGEADLDIDRLPIVQPVEGDEDGDGFVDVSAENPCGSANGSDNSSADDDWSNNCTITRTNQFTDSLYSAGIQRIIHCANSMNATAATVDSFTDGEFGPNTEAEVEAFQLANNLTPDGEVGIQTWPVLRDALIGLDDTTPDGEQEEYGVDNSGCADIALFLGEVDLVGDGAGGFEAVVANWQLTQGASNASPVPFSVGSPFGRID